MARRWLRTAAISGLLALPACRLFVDLSDLGGGDPLPALVDGGVDGSVDGSAIDGGVDGSVLDSSVAAPSCPSFALFCDDFESGDLTKWTDTYYNAGGTFAIEPAMAHAGRFSGRSKAIGSGDAGPDLNAGVRRALLTPVTSGMIAVRAYVYLPTALAGSDTGIIKLQDQSTDMNVKVRGNGLLAVDTDTPDSGPDKVGIVAITAGAWHCVEWHATIGTAGHQKLMLDGQVVVDADENTASASGIVRAVFGVVGSNATANNQALYDDVVVALQPIGCQ